MKNAPANKIREMRSQGFGLQRKFSVARRDQEGCIQGQGCWLTSFSFHDAGTSDKGDKTGGMNGSIVSELDGPKNMGLEKSLKVLWKAKGLVDTVQPDLIDVAGAETALVYGRP